MEISDSKIKNCYWVRCQLSQWPKRPVNQSSYLLKAGTGPHRGPGARRLFGHHRCEGGASRYHVARKQSGEGTIVGHGEKMKFVVNKIKEAMELEEDAGTERKRRKESIASWRRSNSSCHLSKKEVAWVETRQRGCASA